MISKSALYSYYVLDATEPSFARGRSFNDRGDWNGTTVYARGDVSFFGNSLFYCHTNGTTTEQPPGFPSDAGWSQVSLVSKPVAIPGSPFQQVYDGVYNPNDIEFVPDNPDFPAIYLREAGTHSVSFWWTPTAQRWF